jgi:hypothetical protein
MKDSSDTLLTLLCGIIFGMLIFVVISILCGNNIKSIKPINPEIMLTTDGKTIDTLYIYKRP